MEAISKVCPKCDFEAAIDKNYCPNDGTKLVYKTVENACIKCGKQYEKSNKYCPIHGIELQNITPSNKKLMNGNSLDLFRRSVCPNCDAWNNWEKHGNEYLCKSCNSKYEYIEDGLFSIKNAAKTTTFPEKTDSNPYVEILNKIDSKNKEHWIKIFDLLENKKNISRYDLWNWPSFIFGPWRYYWKGLWRKALLIEASAYVIGIAIGFIFYKYFDRIEPLLVFGNFLIKIYFGVSGSKDYYQFIKTYNNDIEKSKKEIRIGRIILIVSIVVAIVAYSIEKSIK
jgi:hypothetical protein